MGARRGGCANSKHCAERGYEAKVMVNGAFKVAAAVNNFMAALKVKALLYA